MLSRSVSAHCLMYAQSASFEYRCCLDRPWSCRELLEKKVVSVSSQSWRCNPTLLHIAG